ncbi:unnamed protein product [Schistosoma turkestanicum]|nr:unnamed protein product [Schistosoma turkestanicum]
MCCKLKVDDLVLLELKMYAESSPQFDLLMNSAIPLSPPKFKQMLIDIISELVVSWSPDSLIRPSRDPMVASIQTDYLPDQNVSLRRELNSADSSDSIHNWIGINVEKQSCESNFKDLNRSQSAGYTEAEAAIPQKQSSQLLVQEDKSFTPVVLAHNARLRQSLVARHAPRPFVCKMIRSASYYGEEGASSLLQERDLGSFQLDVADANCRDLTCDKIEPAIQIRMGTISTPPNKSEVINTEVSKRKETETSVAQNTNHKDSLPEFSHSVPLRKLNTKVDVSPLRERTGNNFASKKLLVKVVKAEELSVKSISGAYCVVELDEPYQRHSTHCSMSGQLFWDQHLLFDLNNNSKRIALEIFELGKRKKSYSRGRAELLLVHLLTNPSSDGDSETNSVNISDTIRRQIPLIDRSGSLLEGTSMSNIVASSTVQSVSGGTSLSPTNQIISVTTNASGQLSVNSIPSITAEFNFMEKATEDFRSRASPSSSQTQRFFSRVSQPTSISNDHHQDQPTTEHCSAFSHSPSLEFPNVKSTLLTSNKNITEHVMHSVTENIQTDSGEETDNLSTSKDIDVVRKSSKDTINEVKSSAILKTGNLSSPISFRRAHYELHTIRSIDEEQHPSIPSSLIYDTTKFSETSSEGHDSSCDLNEQLKESISSNEQHVLQGLSESDGHVKSLTATLVDTNTPSGSKIDSKQGDILCKRSALLCSIGTNLPNNLESASNLLRVDSPISLDNPSASSRPHSLASRLKPTRILSSSVLRSAKRSVTDEPTGSCSNVSSLALLGPSRQLAGVVAGLSSLAADSTAAPTAAALASAMAVVGATGNWQPQLTTDSDSPLLSSGSTILSDLLSRRESKLEASDDSPVPPHSSVSSFGPPVHFVPPPTYVAAGSPGTFTALSQPRRSDASNLSLFRIFRHKKKRFRSVGAEKLVYWETNNLDDLDAISTEGYHRILQDDDCEARDIDQSGNK